MKNINKIFAIAIVALGFSTSAFAQSTGNASTTAVLVTPISVAKTTDMHFGIVAASATAGTVALDYVNGRVATGGVSLPAGSTAQKTAVFTVTGEANSSFSITLPTNPIVMTGGTAGTTVSGFQCEQGATTTLSGGTKVLNVKATLNVPANAIAGTYSNASDLFVTVNYN